MLVVIVLKKKKVFRDKFNRVFIFFNPVASVIPLVSKLTNIDKWTRSEYLKRLTSIIVIRAGHQNSAINTAAQCYLNAVKAIRNTTETTKPWLIGKNTAEFLIAYVH